MAAAAALLLAAPASAADMPITVPVYRPVTWFGGWYLGANAGWLGSANDAVSNTGTDTGTQGLGADLTKGFIPGTVSVPLSGFLGGGQIGHNWQNGNYVVGLEADIDGVLAKSSTTAVFPGGGVQPSTTFSREMDWVSTVRARAGYMVMPAFLIYGTAGLAVGETKVANAFSLSTASASTATSVGWTAGGGAEWMFAPGWSVKGEYLFVDLGDHSSTSTYNYNTKSTTCGFFGCTVTSTPHTSTLKSTVTDTANILRAGVNYHF
jgi:outer membrane immunogenic protein